MRRWASGLTGSSSSMVLLIGRPRPQRTNHRLDEYDLLVGEAVLLVQHLVSPRLVPRLNRHPRVHALEDVLRWLAQRYQEADEACAEVGLDTVGFRLRGQGTARQIRLRAH